MELFQRIEHLIGKKLPLYKTEEDEVMILIERVAEAQRFAKMVRYLDLLLMYSEIYNQRTHDYFSVCL